MKTTDRFVLVLVATLALFLAGCGGGSSTPSTPPAPSGPTPGEMAITDAKTTLMNAEAGLTGASTDAAMLAAYRAIQAAASNLITVLSENGGTAADRGSAVDALNNAATEIGRLERAIAAAEKGNEATIAKLLGALDDLTADTRTTSVTNPPGGDPNNPNSTTSPAFEAVYGKATTVTVRDTVTTPVRGPNAKLKDAVGTTVAGKNGWSGTMVAATDPASKITDTVLVYTNIEAPKSVAFGEVHDLTGGVLPATVIAAGSGDSNIQATDFSTGHAAFIHGTNDATNVNEVIRISGTYAGAPGVYSCAETTANTCTSQGTNNGIRLGGPWTFEPSPGAMAIQKDTNYSLFGWWLREKADGSFFPFVFGGHNTELSTDKPDIPLALTGKATYSGLAVGKFAIAGFPNTGGDFTADASLAVDFEDTTGATGAVTGAVTNFMVSGAEMPWRVDFARVGLLANGRFGATTTGNTATWSIDGIASVDDTTTNRGSYDGYLQRNNVDTDLVPMSATGVWQVPYLTANSSEAFGHMIGAFGVTRDD